MLRSIKDLEGYAVGATDGEIGRVQDFYFDDLAWVARYLVVDTGAWLSSRKVLISPMAIGRPDWTERLLHVWLTKAQVKGSPDIDTDKPVSRQHEIEYSSYYGYPSYWSSAGYWGGGMYPGLMMSGYEGLRSPQAIRLDDDIGYARADTDRSPDGDPHLRSCREVMRYHIHAIDGDIGHVEGMLIDDETWAIRYLIVNTSNWWLGHQWLIAPQWIEGVNWFASKVSIKMSRQSIKDAPAYDPIGRFERREEAELYDHYGYPVYWSDDVLLEPETSRV
jgi:hypothetical protein